MNILVTAGCTQAAIDRVRWIAGPGGGRVGAAVARTAWGRGHAVALATSDPDALSEFGVNPRSPPDRLAVLPYQTFDDLAALLQVQVTTGGFDAVCHTATAGDFLPAGLFAPAGGTFFNAKTREWEARAGRPTMAEEKGGKVETAEPELWVRLVRAPKLTDRFRAPWGFAGGLVTSVLTADVGEDELVGLAEASRKRAGADLVAATTLDGAAHWACLGPVGGRYDRVSRRDLPDRLVAAVETLHQGRAGHG